MALHPYYTTNFADREMFAYNAQVAKKKAELERVLAQPETRATCAISFYFAGNDSKMNEKALNRFQEFLDVIEYNVEPYELY